MEHRPVAPQLPLLALGRHPGPRRPRCRRAAGPDGRRPPAGRRPRVRAPAAPPAGHAGRAWHAPARPADLLDRLRRQRQERLNRYDLGSSLDDIKGKLDQVLQTEREGIQRWLEERRDEVRRGEGSEVTQKAFEKLRAGQAAGARPAPRRPGRAHPRAHGLRLPRPRGAPEFQELLDSLRQHMLQPFLPGMQQSLQNMTPRGSRPHARDAARPEPHARRRARGKEPDFEAFKQKWGQYFPGVESLDQLIEQMSRQIAQMQSLLQSMSPQQRSQLEDMMRSLLLRDEQLEAALSQLAMRLDRLTPLREMQNRVPVQGRRGRDPRPGHAPHGRDAAHGPARARAARRAGARVTSTSSIASRSSSSWGRRRRGTWTSCGS